MEKTIEIPFGAKESELKGWEYTIPEDMRRWLNERLKSTRPQPHWKPSEEQMEWLKDVIETVPMTCRQQVPLESLYNDLKKLL